MCALFVDTKESGEKSRIQRKINNPKGRTTSPNIQISPEPESGVGGVPTPVATKIQALRKKGTVHTPA